MMPSFWDRLAKALAIIMVMPLLAAAAETEENDFKGQVTRPVKDAFMIRRATQKVEEQWRAQQQMLAAEFTQLEGETSRLSDTRETLQESTRATRERIAQKEKQLADIDQIRSRIEPFLRETVAVLHRQVTEGPPFLPEERSRRLDRLDELLSDPQVAVSEKYRKVMEALLVEAEYGNTIEVYQQTIPLAGNQKLVNIFRLGRISLFYQTLDQNNCGFFNVAENQWQPLPAVHNRDIAAAMEIGAKRKPAELLNLPIGRIVVQ